MIRLEQLVHHLIDAFADHLPAQPSEGALIVTDLDLDVPVETRIAADGSVLMTLPRGLLATGFSLPLGRLRVHCEEPEE